MSTTPLIYIGEGVRSLPPKVRENMGSIAEWIGDHSDLDDIHSNTEFMSFAIQLMNRCLYLFKVSSELAPSPQVARRGFTKHQAIVVGHLIRIAKLYEGATLHLARQETELALILWRLVHETDVRGRHVMRKGRIGTRGFVLSSYRPEKEIIEHLTSRASSPFTPLEARMLRKIKNRLRQDRISVKTLLNARPKDLRGEDFRSLLREIGREPMYAMGFGSGSHHVHGDWYDIEIYHLHRSGGYFLPKISYSEPDPRVPCALTIVAVGFLKAYLRWARVDKKGIIQPLVAGIERLAIKLDTKHEETLS